MVRDTLHIYFLLKEGKRTEAVAIAVGREKEAFGQAERLLLALSALYLKLGGEAKKAGQAMEATEPFTR